MNNKAVDLAMEKRIAQYQKIVDSLQRTDNILEERKKVTAKVVQVLIIN